MCKGNCCLIDEVWCCVEKFSSTLSFSYYYLVFYKSGFHKKIRDNSLSTLKCFLNNSHYCYSDENHEFVYDVYRC